MSERAVNELSKLDVHTTSLVLVQTTRCEYTGWEKENDGPATTPCMEVYAFTDDKDRDEFAAECIALGRQFRVFAVERLQVRRTVTVSRG